MTTFAFDVLIDGQAAQDLTLEGATIDYGRTDPLGQPEPPVAVLTLLTVDAAPDLAAQFPQFGLNPRVGPSGFTDLFADVYAGAAAILALQTPVQVLARTDSGFTDVFRGTYEGLDLLRFTGHVAAMDYAPGTVQLTCVTTAETWARLKVPAGVDIPAETDVARVQRYVAAVGQTIAIEGPPGPELVPVAADAPARTLRDLLIEIATSVGGLLYVRRDGTVVYRTPGFVVPDTDAPYDVRDVYPSTRTYLGRTP